MQQSNSRTHVDVTRDELPMHCPMPDSSLWNSHPRVYIPLEEAGEASCAYCGTVFRLVESTSAEDKTVDTAAASPGGNEVETGSGIA